MRSQNLTRCVTCRLTESDMPGNRFDRIPISARVAIGRHGSGSARRLRRPAEVNHQTAADHLDRAADPHGLERRSALAALRKRRAYRLRRSPEVATEQVPENRPGRRDKRAPPRSHDDADRAGDRKSELAGDRPARPLVDQQKTRRR